MFKIATPKVVRKNEVEHIIKTMSYANLKAEILLREVNHALRELNVSKLSMSEFIWFEFTIPATYKSLIEEYNELVELGYSIIEFNPLLSIGSMEKRLHKQKNIVIMKDDKEVYKIEL